MLRLLVLGLLSIGLVVVPPAHAQQADELPEINAEIARLRRAGNYEHAIVLAQRALALTEREFGKDSPQVVAALKNFTLLYQFQGRYAEAEPLTRRAVTIRERLLGPNDPDLVEDLNTLTGFSTELGRYAEAESLLKRSLAILQNALGDQDVRVAAQLDLLGKQYLTLGRYSEAETVFKRSLNIMEHEEGLEHRNVGVSLANLAELYRAQGRYIEAEPLLNRSLAISEKALGPNHPIVAAALHSLALLYQNQGRYAEGEPLLKRALALSEGAWGHEHIEVAAMLNNLGELHRVQQRPSDAEPLFRRALAITEPALGREHIFVGHSLNNLANVLVAQGREAEAEELYKRSLALYEKAFGPNHPNVATSLGNLAALYFVQRDWARAADFWQRSSGVIVSRTQRGTGGGGIPPTAKGKSEAERSNFQFYGLVKAVHRLALSRRSADVSIAPRIFETAQWAQGSQAAASLAQMAARGAKGDAGLASLVRERQDLVVEWQKRDGARTAAISQAPDKRDRTAEAANAAQLVEIDTRLAAIDTRLKAEFPDYAALASPEPLTVEQVQADLRPNEALVLFLDTPEWTPTPEETFIWVVTKTGMRWVRSDLGTPALTREVAALRCGLDSAVWDDESGAARCRDLVKAEPHRDRFGNIRTETLPFDQPRAHKLYKALFGEVEDLIKDKHLLIVPSGPLAQLPFQVLATASTASGDYRSAPWLTRKHAITVLPAVSSLKALRRVAKPSAATKPMIGFGNPLLDGDPAERPWEAAWAKLAREKQACAPTSWQKVASPAEKRRGVVPLATRSGRADLDHLRSQAPLHDTTDELCAVAKDLKLAPNDILLGAKATEATVKRMSGEGRLASYRVLHFATHGTLVGEISGTSEPGLIFTPPVEQTETDDGYLSASEVAALKLDADWVILSACNTAAGGAQGAEALSGLARAFFYAGARALLVSHWSVNSAATVKLITGAVGTITRDKSVGRAEALRRAMLAMIDKGAAHEAHPAFWAPFVVVGEGAAGDAMGQGIGAALPHGTKAVRKPPRKGNEDWSAEFWKKQPY
jgi:CHAT domain-containing protein/tetratricopeptide (TPR) repeat protein